MCNDMSEGLEVGFSRAPVFILPLVTACPEVKASENVLSYESVISIEIDSAFGNCIAVTTLQIQFTLGRAVRYYQPGASGLGRLLTTHTSPKVSDTG